MSEAHPIRRGVRLCIPAGTKIYTAGQKEERMSENAERLDELERRVAELKQAVSDIKLVLVRIPAPSPPLRSDLPAWESVTKCAKCGTTRIGKEGLDWTTNPQQFKYEYIPGDDPDYAEEHMEVICPRCGHGWDEQTKDAGG